MPCWLCQAGRIFSWFLFGYFDVSM
jgi:hypothetical protein